MLKINNRLVLTLGFLILVSRLFAQLPPEPTDGSRVISTAVPFLLIAPDARAGGMGDAGAATTPDEYSMYWNPAKYAFCEKTLGFGIGYVPWLRGLVNDIGLASVCGYGKIGDKQAVAVSLRFFSMGSVTFTNDIGQELGSVKPNEWTIDATYARKFSREFSGAVEAAAGSSTGAGVNSVGSGATGANRDRTSVHGPSGNGRPPRASSLRLPSFTLPFAFTYIATRAASSASTAPAHVPPFSAAELTTRAASLKA